MKIRVYYEDTDAGGIVYHSKYINFCERARSEILFLEGISPQNKNSSFVARDLQATFLKSATLGELLEVTTTKEFINKISMILLQEVWNEKKEKIFSMRIKLVHIKNGKPSKIDSFLLEKLENIF